MKQRSVNMLSGGGGPAEPVLYTRSGLADDVKVKGVAEQAISRGCPNYSAMSRSVVLDKLRAGALRATAPYRKFGFTMAEILLSLTIIGVVAAITLPSLTGNINERTWNTQRKALYARMSQAIALMPALNGYGTIIEDESGSITEDTAAETFITAGLSKVLKINNICNNENLKDCGFAAKIVTLAASNIELPTMLTSLNENNAVGVNVNGTFNALFDTKAAAFETQNGESVLTFYNPLCTSFLAEPFNIAAQKKFCVNFVYDLNGTKGPNTFGKDIGIITAFYPTDSVVVAPVPHAQDAATSVHSSNIASVCKTQDSEYRLPNKEELMAFSINRNLIGNFKGNGDRYWSATLNSSMKQRWWISIPAGILNQDSRFNNLGVRCVKR